MLTALIIANRRVIYQESRKSCRKLGRYKYDKMQQNKADIPYDLMELFMSSSFRLPPPYPTVPHCPHVPFICWSPGASVTVPTRFSARKLARNGARNQTFRIATLFHLRIRCRCELSTAEFSSALSTSISPSTFLCTPDVRTN